MPTCRSAPATPRSMAHSRSQAAPGGGGWRRRRHHGPGSAGAGFALGPGPAAAAVAGDAPLAQLRPAPGTPAWLEVQVETLPGDPLGPNDEGPQALDLPPVPAAGARPAGRPGGAAALLRPRPAATGWAIPGCCPTCWSCPRSWPPAAAQPRGWCAPLIPGAPAPPGPNPALWMAETWAARWRATPASPSCAGRSALTRPTGR